MELLDQILAVLFVLLLVGAAVWALNRKRGLPMFPLRRRTTAASTLAVLERLPLTPQHALHLVRVGDRVVLVGTSPAGVVFEPHDAPFQATFQRLLNEDGGSTR